MNREPKNIAASIRARLLQRSHEFNVEHQLTLARFGGERLLYRLSKSEFADRFILKGAALLLLWMGDATRPTKDIDLLGFGDASAETLNKIFVALCEVEAPDDGLTFMSDTVRVEAIREGQEYGGMRITLMSMLGKVRIPLQVDVGVGDAVVPPPDTIDYPGLLDLPRARLRVYRPETSIAEKTEAMVRLALANSRMKDFFDIRGLAITRSFDGDTLRLALAATFKRRQTPLPSEVPLAMTNRTVRTLSKALLSGMHARVSRAAQIIASGARRDCNRTCVRIVRAVAFLLVWARREQVTLATSSRPPRLASRCRRPHARRTVFAPPLRG